VECEIIKIKWRESTNIKENMDGTYYLVTSFPV
jgi:hypothetical protein